jgi:protein-S-isoprenylcysteine O-methyltransferase
MPLVPLLIGSLFGISELMLALSKRSGAAAQHADDGSLRRLWLGISAAVVAAVWVAQGTRHGFAPLLARLWPLACVLFALGIVLRWWSIVKLGRFFTVDVAIAPGQYVIDTGPYRYLRHPSYSGALLAFVGYGIALCNWWSLAILLVPITAMFLHRIRIEEAALQRGIGDSYTRYMERSWRLLPYVY